jgi:hypothetical protein
MLNAKPFMESEQQLFWRVGGRVTPPFSKGKAGTRAENMHVGVARSGR